MFRVSRALGLFLLLLLLPGCGGGGGSASTAASAQAFTSTSTLVLPQVGGRLVDSLSNPVAGLSVRASASGAARKTAAARTIEVTSDANGGFELTGLEADTLYKLTIDGGAGLATLTTEFRIDAATTNLHLNLTIPSGSGIISFSLPTPLRLLPPALVNGIQLTWTASTDPRFAAYELFRATDPRVTTASTQIAAVSQSWQTSADDRTTRPAAAYYRLFEKDWVPELNGYVEVGTNVQFVASGGSWNESSSQDYHLDAAFASSDLGSRQPLTTATAENAFVVDRQGNVLVPASIYGDQPVTVYRYDGAGMKVGELTLDGISLGVDSNGDIWACQAMQTRGRITHYDSGGSFIESVSFDFPPNAITSPPCQLAVDVERRVVYVAMCNSLRHVVKVDLDTATATVPAPLFSATNCVAIDSHGVLLTANNAWSLQRFDAALNFLGLITTSGVPYCLNIGADGTLYVATSGIGGAVISRNDPASGALLGRFQATTVSNCPNYVYTQVDPQGRVYVKYPDVPMTRWVPNLP